MSTESKYVGFRWPPREWWFGGHWTQNHPLSHLLGGFGIAAWLLLRASAYAASPFIGQTFDVATVAGAHEYLQIEMSGSGNSRYPVYSAIGDAVFVILGWLLASLLLRLV